MSRRAARHSRTEPARPGDQLIGEAAFNLAQRHAGRASTRSRTLYRRSFAIRGCRDRQPTCLPTVTGWRSRSTAWAASGGRERLRQLLADRERVFGLENTDVADTPVSRSESAAGPAVDAAAIADRLLDIYRRSWDQTIRRSSPVCAARRRPPGQSNSRPRRNFRDALRIRLRLWRGLGNAPPTAMAISAAFARRRQLRRPRIQRQETQDL